MPTVPAGPSISPDITPGVRVSTGSPIEAFGGGDAARPIDLSGATQNLHAVWAEEQQKADQVATLDATNRAWDSEKTYFHDPEKGAFNVRGKDSIAAADAAMEAWKKDTSDIEASLANEDQKRAFHVQVQQRAMTLDGQLQQHVSTELKRYDDETFSSSVATNVEKAALAYDQPDEVQRLVDAQKATIADYARRQGMPPAVAAQQTTDAVSKMHRAVITQYLVGDQDQAAQAYYDAHAKELNGSDTISVRKDLEVGSTRGESQRQADAIVNAGGTDAEMRDKVKAITDPRVRDETAQRIDKAISDRQQNAVQVRTQTYGAATNVIEQTHDVTKIPPNVWSSLTLGERKDLRSYADELQKGTPVKTDLDTWYKLRNAAANPATQNAFIGENLSRYKSVLSDTDFKELVGVQEGLKKNSVETQAKLHGIRTSDQIVETTLRSIGLGVNPLRRGTDAVTMDTIKRSIDQEVTFEEQHTQKPVTPARVQEIADDIITKHVIAGSSQEKRMYEFAPAENPVLTVNDIPRRERTELTAWLQSGGFPITDASLVAHYRAYLNRLGARGPQ